MDMQNQGTRISVSQGGFSLGENKQSHPFVVTNERQGGGMSSKQPDEKHDEKRLDGKKNLAVKIFDVCISVSLVAIFLGVPLFFTGITMQGIAFEKQLYFYVWTLLALVAWAAKGVVCGEMKVRKTPLDVPILILLAAYVLTVAFSVDRWHSFWGFFGNPSRGLMNVIALILIYYVLASHFTRKLLNWIVGSLIVGNFLITGWSFVVLLGAQLVPQKIAAVLPISFMGSVSGLAIYLGMMVPVLVAAIYAMVTNAKLGKIVQNAATFFMLIVLVANLLLLSALYSFAPWLAVLIGVSFFLVYILAQLVRPKGGWSILAMGVFVAVLAILMIGKSTFGKINLPAEVSPNFSLSWEIAKSSLKEKLIVGSGPGTYGYAFSKFKPQEFNLNPYYNLRFYEGTGLFFEMLATTGLVGMIALILAALSFVSVSVYLLSREKERNKIYSLGFFSSSLVFIVAALTMQIAGAVLILGMLVSALAIMALLLESNAEENWLKLSLQASPKFALASAFVFMVVSAGVVFLFVFVGKAFLADIYAGLSIRDAQITEDKSVAKMVKAINLFPQEGRYLTRLGQEYMVLANGEFLKNEKERDVNVVKNHLSNSVQAAAAGKNLMNNDALAQEVLAQVYENMVYYDPASVQFAKDAYKRAQELEPQNPAYFVKLGQLQTADISKKSAEEQKQEIGAAKDLFQKAIDKKNNFAQGYAQLASAQSALDEKDEAIKSMSNAVVLEKTNANYVFTLAKLYQDRGKDEDLKNAEEIYKNLLQANNKDITTLVSLGILYEKKKLQNEALEQYKKALTALPEGTDEVREKIQKMIENLNQGKGNLTAEVAEPAQQEQMQNVPNIPESELNN